MQPLQSIGAPGSRGARRQAVQPGAVRAHNLSVVLEQVRLAGHLTRARIAQRVGLTRATVSDLVEQLLQGGMLVESDAEADSRVGRPGVPLSLARQRFVALGLEVQADRLHVVLVDLDGETLSETHPAADLRGVRAEEALTRAAEVALPLARAATGLGATLVGVGVAVPGIVSDDARVHVAPNLGWTDVDVAATLEGILGRPALVRNDADLAVRAELRARRRAGAAEPGSLLFVDGNIGIGGALVIHDALQAGQHGWASEIGHTTVDVHGPRCACGARGCLEVFAGQRALLAGAALPPDAPASALLALLEAGEPAATAAVRRAAEALGVALANTLNVVDVGTVVLGGVFAGLAPHLAPVVEKILAEHVLAARWLPVRLEAALTGSEAGAVGAALTVLDAVFADPVPWLGQTTRTLPGAVTES